MADNDGKLALKTIGNLLKGKVADEALNQIMAMIADALGEIGPGMAADAAYRRRIAAGVSKTRAANAEGFAERYPGAGRIKAGI